jgi:murein L,D-transpeptidase YafK
MRKLLASLLLVGFFFQGASAVTLSQLLEELGSLSPAELSRKIKELPQEEKIKLQVLLLSYSGEDEKVKELLDKLYSGKLVTNILEPPEGLPAIVVDKTKEVLYVVKMVKGAPFIVRKFPCITGKRPGDKLEEGDQRTPEGIYFPLFWRSNLPALYGIGAFPLNYPNLLDRKILKRDGHGIWIHGTNDPDRPPHSTNGCIVLKNEYLKELKRLIVPRRTPVVIVSSLSYAPKKQYLDEQRSLLNFILKWKRAWENTPKGLSDYFSCYSKSFVWRGGGYEEWVKYKRRVTKSKTWIRIKLADITAAKDGRLLQFGNIYVVRFRLSYASNNFKSRNTKLLYIVKEGNQWKIIGEENL